MHELSLASAIADKVMNYAESRPGQRVIEVKLGIGEWMCVQDEQLTFCYRAITQETPIGDSTLEIERIPGSVKCPHCGYEGRPKYWDEAQWLGPIATLQCPTCDQTAEITQGQECAIRAIKYAA
jgi:hydrogenase nickel incorporation protein HypA/HybF